MTAPAQVNGAAIRALLSAYLKSHSHMRGFACCSAHDVADAAPDLLAEVERLREERHTTNEALDEGVKAIREKDARVAELEAQAALVAEFVAARAEVITAIRNCHPDNVNDYQRWQGHAESRRQLAETLGLPVAWPAKEATS